MRCDWREVGNRDANGVGDVYCAREGCGRRIRGTPHRAEQIRGEVSCFADRTPRILPCSQLGPLVRMQLCTTCHGKVELKVMRCAVHGECTLGKRIDGLACCGGCPDYAATALAAVVVSAGNPCDQSDQ